MLDIELYKIIAFVFSLLKYYTKYSSVCKRTTHFEQNVQLVSVVCHLKKKNNVYYFIFFIILYTIIY